MTNWKFPSNDFGQVNGINHPGMNYFIGKPLKSLAREICQNSLDAGTKETVKIEFKSFSIANYDLPDYKYLKLAFERCLKFWKPQNDKKTRDFFNKAIETIEAPEVNMLRISDFNTCGLTGSGEEWNTHWSNLIKASGSSDKSGVSGGSFGIGKFAPFACSDFRTVFYSTYDQEEVKAGQGVARLVTFEREDGHNTEGTGYFGNDERNTPIAEMLCLEEGYHRREYGTDIYIAGFSSYDDWVSEMVISIIDDFIGALWNEQLEVIVGDVTIKKTTLGRLIEEYKDTLSKFAIDYYTVLTSSETVWFTDDFMNAGEVKLGLLVHEELNKKVAMIRKNGMKIMDQGNINQNLPFAGVFFINGDKINKILRAMENPEHTKWEPNRVQNKAHARLVVKNLKIYLRDKLEELIKNQPDEVLDAEGVGEFLPDEVSPESDKKTSKVEVIEDKIKQVEIKIKERKPRAASTVSKKEEAEKKKDTGGETTIDGDDIHTRRGEGTTQGGDRDPDAKNTDDSEKGKALKNEFVKVSPEKIRVIALSKREGKYSVIIDSTGNYDNCEMRIHLAGEVGTYPVKILEGKTTDGIHLEAKNNTLKGFSLVTDKQVKLMISIDYDDYCGMEVELYGNKI